MISWIIFFVGAIFSFVFSVSANAGIMNVGQILLIFIVALIIICLVNGTTAIICSKYLPNKYFNNNLFYCPTKKEYNLYNKFGIKKWKDKTLEWGELNGFSKDRIERPKDPEYIKRFILECNKGFLTHFVSLFTAGIIFLVVPKMYILPMALPMFITSFLLNFIPIMILRYNSYRLKTVLKFIERHNEK